MSVALHDPARDDPAGRVRTGLEREPRDPRRERLVIAGVVAATLAVIVGPVLAAALGLVGRYMPVDEEDPLTAKAQRVLDEIPGAFEAGGLVVIPAASDTDVVWVDAMDPSRVDGEVVDLGVHGLASYGYLPSRGTAPSWLGGLTLQDEVYSDVGALSFACTRWAGDSVCRGTLLMENAGSLYTFRSGLPVGESPEQVRVIRVLDGGLPTELALGSAPAAAEQVLVTLVGPGEPQVRARVSAPGDVGGSTLWWVTVPAPVAKVTFLDETERVVDQVTLAD